MGKAAPRYMRIRRLTIPLDLRKQPGRLWRLILRDDTRLCLVPERIAALEAGDDTSARPHDLDGLEGVERLRALGRVEDEARLDPKQPDGHDEVEDAGREAGGAMSVKQSGG